MTVQISYSHVSQNTQPICHTEQSGRDIDFDAHLIGGVSTAGIWSISVVYAQWQAMDCIVEPRISGIEYPETSVSICTFAAANLFKISFSQYILFLIQTAS